MIKSQDRSGWFGASDTHFIVGNWETKTFARWWLIKLGVIHDNFTTEAMIAGTHWEHRILDHLGIEKRDRQIKKPFLRLRVNLDGDTDIIHEVKTYGGEFKITKPYWQQSQVEMFAAKKPLEIVAYKLLPDDYNNFFNPVDPDRITRISVERDSEWLNAIYLPRLRYLAKCLVRRRTPKIEEVRYG